MRCTSLPLILIFIRVRMHAATLNSFGCAIFGRRNVTSSWWRKIGLFWPAPRLPSEDVSSDGECRFFFLSNHLSSFFRVSFFFHHFTRMILFWVPYPIHLFIQQNMTFLFIISTVSLSVIFLMPSNHKKISTGTTYRYLYQYQYQKICDLDIFLKTQTLTETPSVSGRRLRRWRTGGIR